MKPSERIKIIDIEGKTYEAVRSTDPRDPNPWALLDPVRGLSTADDEHFIDADGRPYSRV